MGDLDLTPWCRTALIAAGLRRQDVEARIPDRCRVMGSAKSAHGPFRFVFVDERTGASRETTARGWSRVPEAIDTLLDGLVAA